MTHYHIKKSYREKGIAALLLVVLLGATSLVMAYSASFLGLGELDIGYTAQKGAEALALADGCMEEALGRLRINPNYPGAWVAVPGGACVILVATNGNTRTITALGAISGGGYAERVRAVMTLMPSSITGSYILMNSWEVESK